MNQSHRPLKLHDLLGSATEWNDELWSEAMAYLNGRLTIDSAQWLSQCAPAFGLQSQVYAIAKRDYLSFYRQLPPTVLLGMYDFARSAK